MKGKSAFRLYGIFGSPLGHSLSPVMQEKAFFHTGIRAYYLCMELQEKAFRRTMKRLDRLPLEGFNVTVPYKEKVLPFLGTVSEEAKKIGAVNTVYRRRGKWAGANTDVYGFLESLKKEGKIRVRGKKTVVIGAGGASRAVVYGLAREGAREICVLNRSPRKADALVRTMSRFFRKTAFRAGQLNRENFSEAFQDSVLVINATSAGLKPTDPEVVPSSWIPRAGGKKQALFYDLIYFPEKTRFLKTAAKRGYKVLGGAGMLVYQGAKAFELWTGRKAPAALMYRTLKEGIQKRTREAA